MKPVFLSNILAERCPDILQLWDYEKNTGISPQDISIHHKTKAWWKCDRGHSWQAPVNGVASNGTRCPYCAGYRAIPGETDLMTLFPELAAEWDYNQNLDCTPDTVAPNTRAKIWWKCAKGHSYQSAPYSRTGNGAGCPYCAGRKVLKGFNDLKTLRPMLANEWYQPLNGDLKPSDVTLGSNKKVWWQCSKDHVWEACVYSRTRCRGSGCPICKGVVKLQKIKYFDATEPKRYKDFV